MDHLVWCIVWYSVLNAIISFHQASIWRFLTAVDYHVHDLSQYLGTRWAVDHYAFKLVVEGMDHSLRDSILLVREWRHQIVY